MLISDKHLVRTRWQWTHLFLKKEKQKHSLRGRGFAFEQKWQHLIVKSSQLSTGRNTMAMDSPFFKKGKTKTQFKRERLLSNRNGSIRSLS